MRITHLIAFLTPYTMLKYINLLQYLLVFFILMLVSEVLITWFSGTNFSWITVTLNGEHILFTLPAKVIAILLFVFVIILTESWKDFLRNLGKQLEDHLIE